MPSPNPQAASPEDAHPFPIGKEPKELEASLRLLIKAVEQSPVSVIITDTRGIIQYVNPKFTQLMGFTAEETIGKTPRIIKGGFLSRDFYRHMWETILAGNEWHGVFHNQTKAGQLVWEVASISPIRDDAGTITHFVGIKEDITELKRLQEQVEYMARHDQLTGLPNRFLFQDRLAQALVQSKRRKAQFALLYLDLDEFKAVNDSFGHEAGDTLLSVVGQRLLRCVRESDTVARMGGDEFTVVLSDIEGAENASHVAGLIVEALGQPIATLPGQTTTIGASIGITLYPQDGQDAALLLAKADRALYQAKRQGGHGFRFASGESLD